MNKLKSSRAFFISTLKRSPVRNWDNLADATMFLIMRELLNFCHNTVRTICSCPLILILTLASCSSEEEPNDSASTSLDTNNAEYVDLGLSVKWATCNVGAEEPYEIGNLYSWGEVSTKDRYMTTTYQFFTKDDTNSRGYSISKYCTKSENGNVDSLTHLEPEDDVVRQEMGGGWRMPTLKEVNELIRSCKIKRDTLSNIPGVLLTGPNGNTMFVPGQTRVYDTYDMYQEKYTRHQDVQIGGFWSSDLNPRYEQTDYHAYIFRFDMNIRGRGVIIEGYSSASRDYGLACRGVIE